MTRTTAMRCPAPRQPHPSRRCDATLVQVGACLDGLQRRLARCAEPREVRADRSSAVGPVQRDRRSRDRERTRLEARRDLVLDVRHDERVAVLRRGCIREPELLLGHEGARADDADGRRGEPGGGVAWRHVVRDDGHVRLAGQLVDGGGRRIRGDDDRVVSPGLQQRAVALFPGRRHRAVAHDEQDAQRAGRVSERTVGEVRRDDASLDVSCGCEHDPAGPDERRSAGVVEPQIRHAGPQARREALIARDRLGQPRPPVQERRRRLRFVGPRAQAGQRGGHQGDEQAGAVQRVGLGSVHVADGPRIRPGAGIRSVVLVGDQRNTPRGQLDVRAQVEVGRRRLPLGVEEAQVVPAAVLETEAVELQVLARSGPQAADVHGQRVVDEEPEVVRALELDELTGARLVHERGVDGVREVAVVVAALVAEALVVDREELVRQELVDAGAVVRERDAVEDADVGADDRVEPLGERRRRGDPTARVDGSGGRGLALGVVEAAAAQGRAAGADGAAQPGRVLGQGEQDDQVLEVRR